MTTKAQTPASDASAVGLQSRIRAALKDIADTVASRSTRTAIAVPGNEISAAMYEIFSNAARIPDYDHDAAGVRRYSSTVEYVSDEIPSDPIDLMVRADTDGDSRVIVEVIGVGVDTTIPLDLQVAEQLFLSGLAAVAYARAVHDKPTPVD
jgi:hypothetical protein